MRTLHIAPSDSAGGCLRQAIRDAGRDDEVLSWPDNLSCGPIASDDPSARAEWWAPFQGDWDIEADLTAFWARVSITNDRLVVWFGRHSASELAFFLAWAHRLGARPYDIVDVTGLRFPSKREDGTPALSAPVGSVGISNPDRLRTLLGSEQPATAQHSEEARQSWCRMKAEDAPFRVVTATGLVSAPIDYFDPSLLERATPEWKKIARVIAETMAYTDEPYIQVGDVMLLARVVVLVGEGKLLADGDPRDMRSCRVRLRV
jgi:hypothetical protein